MKTRLALLAASLLWVGLAQADEEPISGTIKAVDVGASTLIIQTTAKGKPEELTIDIKPTTRILRFSRSSEPWKAGFVEQVAALADLKLGWIVSVTTKHDGGREVAEVVKVVFER